MMRSNRPWHAGCIYLYAMQKHNDHISSGREEERPSCDNEPPLIAQQRLNKRGRPIIPTSSLHGMPVTNDEGDDLGIVSELMIEMQRGTVAYAILKFEDDKSFAVPYSMLQIDPDAKTIQANIQREVFEHGRGIRPSNNGNTGRQN